MLAAQYPGDSVTVTFNDPSGIPVGDDPDGVELPPELRWTRTWERWQRGGDSRAALDELEAQWAAVGVRRTGIGNHGLLIAVETGNLAAVDRWAERILDNGWTDPWSDKLMSPG